MTFWGALILSMVLGSGLQAAILVEQARPSASPWVIPFSKYVLDNGLTVLVHEDHSDPLVHVEVTYHVGSAREESGRSGFAHFFEHMMFQGSKHVPYNAHFKIITESGGRMNGSASRDQTNYYQTVPKNQLETVLWLESDRMGFFLDSISQEKFDVQRDTVKNEKRQNYDNRPYGLSGEYLYKVLYPVGHPYYWQTIGDTSDLDRVSINDLKQFFMRWYCPNNAILAIGGDVDTKAAIQLAEKYFGSIPSGPKMPPMQPWVPKLTGTQYVSYQGPYVQIPQLTIVFPTIPRLHPDEPALDALAMIVGQGPNSILYQSLVKTNLASSVEAYHYTSELAGEFTIVVTGFPGSKLAPIEAEVRKSLRRLSKGVSKDDVTRFISSYETGVMTQRQSVENGVRMLSRYALQTGSANMLPIESARYRAVTPALVSEVYGRYVGGHPSVVLSVVPKGQASLRASADSIDMRSSALAAGQLDRSKRPTPDTPPRPAQLPIWNSKIGSIPVMGITNTQNELVTIRISFSGGDVLAAQQGFPAGAAELLAKMMGEDSQKMTSEQLNAELEKIGASVSVGASKEEMTVTITSLRSRLGAAMKLASERVESPAFKNDQLARVKKVSSATIVANHADADWMADYMADRMVYGLPNAHSRPMIGYLETVNSITSAQLKQLHRLLFAQSHAVVSVVGELGPNDVSAELRWLGRLPKSAPEVRFNEPMPSEKADNIVVVNLPDAAQVEMRVVTAAPPFDATGNYYLSQLFNFPIGGNFNSRINLQLREVRGFSYGAYSYVAASKFPGKFTLASAVRVDAIGQALADTLSILDSVSQIGISDSETRLLKTAIAQQEALKYETFGQKLDLLDRIQKYKLPPSYLQARSAVLASVSSANLNDVGKKLVSKPKVIILVGDEKQILPQLKPFTIPIEVISRFGPEYR